MITIDKEGRRVNVYDYVTADQLESKDQIFYKGDPVELSDITDDGDSIMVKGYSHLTGDSVTYILTADTEVGLWTA